MSQLEFKEEQCSHCGGTGKIKLYRHQWVKTYGGTLKTEWICVKCKDEHLERYSISGIAPPEFGCRRSGEET